MEVGIGPSHGRLDVLVEFVQGAVLGLDSSPDGRIGVLERDAELVEPLRRRDLTDAALLGLLDALGARLRCTPMRCLCRVFRLEALACWNRTLAEHFLLRHIRIPSPWATFVFAPDADDNAYGPCRYNARSLHGKDVHPWQLRDDRTLRRREDHLPAWTVSNRSTRPVDSTRAIESARLDFHVQVWRDSQVEGHGAPAPAASGPISPREQDRPESLGLAVVFGARPDVHAALSVAMNDRREKAGVTNGDVFRASGEGELYRPTGPDHDRLPAPRRSSDLQLHPQAAAKRPCIRRTPASVRAQPAGGAFHAMLNASVPEFTRPMNSSINLGGWPAAWIVVGFSMRVAIMDSSCFVQQPRARVVVQEPRLFPIRLAFWSTTSWFFHVAPAAGRFETSSLAVVGRQRRPSHGGFGRTG